MASYVSVHLHHPGDQSARELEDFIIYQMECARRLVAVSERFLKDCKIYRFTAFTATWQYPDDKLTMILDLSKFGLSNMDWNCVSYVILSSGLDLS